MPIHKPVVRDKRRPSTSAPTPINISRRMRNILVAGLLVALLVLLWRVPSVLMFALGGSALAIVLSFPVRLLSRVMPRWLAILLSFLLLAALAITMFTGVVPIVLEQLGALANAIPAIAERIDEQLPRLLKRSVQPACYPFP
jgi:predicted PurR-regulated permease PerM